MLIYVFWAFHFNLLLQDEGDHKQESSQSIPMANLGTRVPTTKRTSQEGFGELRRELENYKDQNDKLQDARSQVMKCNLIMIVSLFIIVFVTIVLAIMSPWMWSKAINGGLNANDNAIAIANAVANAMPVPLGTILAWVPRVGKADASHTIPMGWLPCNGTRIPKGPWKNQLTPDLNTAERFLRGGSEDDALKTQEDKIKQHNHGCTATSSSSPHTHNYQQAYRKDDDGDICGTYLKKCSDPDTLAYQKNASDSSTVPVNTHCVVGDVPSSAGAGEETRPVNMKVVFIVKCW